MNFYKKIRSKVFRKLKNSLEKENLISCSFDSDIHKSVELKGATISGNVKIKEGCKIIGGVKINAASSVSIGRYTSLNGPNTDIYCKINSVGIGSFCSIARNVSIQEFNHKFDTLTTYHIHQNLFREDRINDICSKGSILIGNDVWIGTHSVILSGSKIGNGAVIAANSVVSGEIPAYAIAAGTPAKVLKYRFDKETIHRVEELRWWNWDIQTIIRNKELFNKIWVKEIN